MRQIKRRPRGMHQVCAHPGGALAHNLCGFPTNVLIAVFFKYSSLAAIIAAIFAPLYYVFGSGIAWKTSAPIGVAIAAITLFLLYRHRANISRLIKGTEPKIGAGKKA